MAQVQGICDDKFIRVKELFQEFLTSGEERGASITVNVGSKNVIDLWGGYHANTDEPWQADTITAVFSCTKTVTALAALIVVDRGLIDVNENVSKYWPEFVINGKQDVKVRHLLSHTSGLSGWAEKVSFEDICDTEGGAARLAKQAPWWEPGSASGYHVYTYGHLIGELVRRVSGKSLAQFIADEITLPLGADFQLGVAKEDRRRLTDVIPPPQSNSDVPGEDTLMFKSAANPPITGATANTELWKGSELGAASGFSNARSLARILSVISLGGEVDGTRLLSPSTIQLIFLEQSCGSDLVVGIPLRLGIGFGLTGGGSFVDWLPDGQVCYWGGFGGSMVIMDLDRRLTIAYAMNRMEDVGLGSDRTKAYVKAVYEAL